MLRILVAPDKFKGSLGGRAVAENIAAGLSEVLPQAKITLLPVADGGEGTAEVICAAAGGEWCECPVHDSLGREVTARYAVISGGKTAVMEMSQASGLALLAPEERDILRANTFGTGEMLLDAAARGVDEIIIGLGGSATNDGGFGMARALGFHFHDADSEDLTDGPLDLLHLARVVPPPHLKLPRIVAAADVRNPLLGANGATRVFAPQKGATPEEVEKLELALERLAHVMSVVRGEWRRDLPGAGAAGGLGYGLMMFCEAEMRSGFEVVAERIGLEEAVRAADVVITGEGRLDAQTRAGKAPAGVAELARKHGKRACAIVGEVAEGREGRELFDRVLALGRGEMAALLKARARELGESLR